MYYSTRLIRRGTTVDQRVKLGDGIRIEFGLKNVNLSAGVRLIIWSREHVVCYYGNSNINRMPLVEASCICTC